MCTLHHSVEVSTFFGKHKAGFQGVVYETQVNLSVHKVCFEIAYITNGSFTNISLYQQLRHIFHSILTVECSIEPQRDNNMMDEPKGSKFTMQNISGSSQNVQN